MGGDTFDVGQLFYTYPGDLIPFELILEPGLPGDFTLLYGESGALASADASEAEAELNTRYSWTGPGPGWATGHRVALAVKLTQVAATGAPTITGTPQVGEELTADTTTITDPNGVPTDASAFTYQWVRVAGGTETDIPGATNSAYTLTSSDAEIKVTVSFDDLAGFSEGPLTSAATDTVVTNNPATGAPTVTGTAQVGDVLSVDTTTITDADGVPTDANAFTYQWSVDGTDVSGAEAPNYYPTDDDVGKTITVSVSFTDDASYSEGPLASAATDAVAGSDSVSVPWSGTMTVASFTFFAAGLGFDSSDGSLDGDTFTIQGVPHTLTYLQYQTGGGPFRFQIDPGPKTQFSLLYGAAVTILTGEPSSRGGPFSYETGGSQPDPGWSEGDKVALTIKLTQVAAQGAPSITGTAQVGETLGVDTSGIADDNGKPTGAQGFTYQWVRVDSGTETDITGADSPLLLPHRRRRGQDSQGQGQLHRQRGLLGGAADQRRQRRGCRVGDGEGHLVVHHHVGKPPNNPSVVGFSRGLPGIHISDIDFDLGGTTYIFGHMVSTSNPNLLTVRVEPATSPDLLSSMTFLANGAEYAHAAATVYLVRQFSGDFWEYRWPFTGTAWESGDRVAAALMAVQSEATGAPTITGTTSVGEELTADTTTIVDANGVPTDASAFTYQWVRVDGGTETDIPGATNSAYTLTDDDLGKTIKVKVSFNDLAGFSEGPLTSAATDTVVTNNPATGAPTVSKGQIEVWSPTMTVGAVGVAQLGFFDSDGVEGSLSTATFTVSGATYIVSQLAVGYGFFTVILDKDIPHPFVITVGGETFSSQSAGGFWISTGFQYEWSDPGFSWSENDPVPISLKVSERPRIVAGGGAGGGTRRASRTRTV